MGSALHKPRLTPEEYLAWEAAQDVKHEFVEGEVFAMAGAEERHVVVTGNLLAALHAAVSGTSCRVYVADMKLRVEAANAFFYPDLMVCCSATDTGTLVKREPRLIIEVLSPSTAAYDRGAKFAAYRTLASLREFALVDPVTRRVDLYRREASDALWVLHPSGPGEAVTFASMDLTVGAAALWAQVDEPPGTAA